MRERLVLLGILWHSGQMGKTSNLLTFSRLIEEALKNFNKILDTHRQKSVLHKLKDCGMSGLAIDVFPGSITSLVQAFLEKKQRRNNLRTMFQVEKIPSE